MADLHIFFLPFLAPGHMIPLVDLACIFARRGIKATVVTTTANVPLIQPTIDIVNAGDASLRHPIQLLPLYLPCSEVGIPEGHENLTAFPDPDASKLVAATDKLELSFSLLLQTHRPDCIVADLFYPWAIHVAKQFATSLISFHGSNCFVPTIMSILHGGELNQDEIETERPIEVPGIPSKIHLSLSQLPNFVLRPAEFQKKMRESYSRSHGIVMNSFYELERDYVDRAPNSSNRKLWFVGPVSLQNRDLDAKIVRGRGAASMDDDYFLSWLGTKTPRSVLYVCFGSLGRFTATQMREIARGLEATDRPFIWVVWHAGEPSDWLPEGFENRAISSGKGLMVQGWAPQLLILNHEAVGGFVTHCGWNSCLEAITAGVPVITWPLFADQFLNEKLLVDVHRMGIAIGAKLCSLKPEERTPVKGEQLTKAVDELMGNGEEAEERRKRARALGETARRAVEEGGSSYENMTRLIQELISLKAVGGSSEFTEAS
ncbi:putative UDP-glucosyl transferase 73B6 [Curcuma longa]|uniref:putative UDP-glucosyl transferase 73B6 n=1 Tax=Curcuma longa TaxID=136217 RepID=UPI003D9E1718